MQNLIFSLNTVAPVFMIVFVGYFLKKFGRINDNFVAVSSRVVFNVALPCLVFVKLATTDFTRAFKPELIVLAYLGTFFIFIMSWALALFLSKEGRDQGAFIQASVRSNYAIVGFAIIAAMFGDDALSNASILLAFIMPIYNALAVIALTVPLQREKQVGVLRTIIEIFKNPLIIAVFVALPFSIFEIHLSLFIFNSLNYLASLSLPLALLGIGASLNFESIKKDSRLAIIATTIKIIITPLLLVFIAVKMGIAGQDLGILFVLFACPTAIATFVMAEAMGANGELTGNIIVMSTLGSVGTISIGIFILKSLGLI
ncbi:AEC family transporter [candidate division KSB1 bacterium]|nr:AEC family transporter [candidate division KSB1 bacterium]